MSGAGASVGVGTGAAGFGAVVGGAVGSIVGQGLMMAAGYQDRFSWKQVGISALGAGITAGIGAAFNSAGGFATAANLTAKGSNTAAAINAVVNSVATQGVMVASSLQDKFSWKSVAASTIGAAVGNQIGSSIGNSSFG